MRVAIALSATGGPWGDFVTYVPGGRAPGVALCFVAEAWGTDAVSPLAYLAAKTERILLASGIMQISASHARHHSPDRAHPGDVIRQSVYSRPRRQRPAGGRGLRHTACPSPTP